MKIKGLKPITGLSAELRNRYINGEIFVTSSGLLGRNIPQNQSCPMLFVENVSEPVIAEIIEDTYFNVNNLKRLEGLLKERLRLVGFIPRSFHIFSNMIGRNEHNFPYINSYSRATNALEFSRKDKYWFTRLRQINKKKADIPPVLLNCQYMFQRFIEDSKKSIDNIQLIDLTDSVERLKNSRHSPKAFQSKLNDIITRASRKIITNLKVDTLRNEYGLSAFSDEEIKVLYAEVQKKLNKYYELSHKYKIFSGEAEEIPIPCEELMEKSEAALYELFKKCSAIMKDRKLI